jgi:transposase-like protein
MQLKGSYGKERCPFCDRDDRWEEVKLNCGRKRRICDCGYTWLKESWREMMTRTGKVWDGHKYTSDYIEENEERNK